MTVADPNLVTWLVLILLVLVFLQGIAIAVGVLVLGQKLAALKGRTGQYAEQLGRLLGQLDQLLEQAERVHEQLPGQLEKVNKSLRWANQRIGEVDHYAEKNLALLSGQLGKFNEKADRVLSGFGLATYRIQTAIINPTRHIAAVLSAIQESVVWLLTRGRREKDELTYSDEQNFI